MEATRTTTTNRKWMASTAGILSIVAGSIKLLGALGLLIAIGITGDIFHYSDFAYWAPFEVSGMLWTIALPLMALGGLSLVGGIFALQRRRWGWALAGSIAAFFPVGLLGMLATVFTGLSKDEFES